MLFDEIIRIGYIPVADSGGPRGPGPPLLERLKI